MTPLHSQLNAQLSKQSQHLLQNRNQCTVVVKSADLWFPMEIVLHALV